MWQNNSVFYQVYPLGALGAPFENDGVLEHRLDRMHDWIPSLYNMGIDCVLFNPLFQSHTHGYDTIDYKQVDVRLGDNSDLKKVMEDFHSHSMRVIFDAVFNHVGRGFFAFEDVLKHREQSMYKGWFYIDFNSNNNYDDHLSYRNWEGNNNLIQLNLQNPVVIDYLLSVIDFWMDEFEVDGLRLDVAYCLDRNFLKTVRAHVKSKNPDFFLLGETLHGDYNQWVNEDMLDSCTNYECYKGLYSSFNTKNLFEICHSYNRQFGKEPWCLYTNKHLFNFVDNHDVVRVASILENKKHLPLIYTMLFTMPGIPCIYYGSEWGIEGKKNWNDTDLRPEVHMLECNDLTKYIEKLIQIKHENKALNQGDYTSVVLTNLACIFERTYEDQTLWIAINMDEKPVDLHVNFKGNATDLLNNEEIFVENNVKIDAFSALILQLNM